MAHGRQAEKEAAQAGEDAVRKTAEETRRAAEETRRVGSAAVDASAKVAQASADLMKRNVETAQRAWEAASQTANKLAATSMQQLSRASGVAGENTEGATQRSLANVETIVQSGALIAGAMQDISREFLDFAQRRMQQNIDSLDKLANCRTPQDFLTAQSELARSQIEDFIQSTRRIAEVSLRMAEEANNKASPSLAPRP
jgi:hypothetical protein